MTRIRKQPLSKQHDRAGFDCGVAELNTFIQKTARRQDERHLVRTTVLVDTDQPERILAFYSTAPCEIAPPPGVTGTCQPHMNSSLKSYSRFARSNALRAAGNVGKLTAGLASRPDASDVIGLM